MYSREAPKQNSGNAATDAFESCYMPFKYVYICKQRNAPSFEKK